MSALLSIQAVLLMSKSLVRVCFRMARTSPARSALRLVLLCLALAGMQTARADYVGQSITAEFLDLASQQLIASRGASGLQVGDQISYIIQFTPYPGGTTEAVGAGAYLTDYIPAGTQVVGAQFVQYDSSTGISTPIAPTSPADVAVAMLPQYSETGIFYSSDSRTAFYTSDSSGVISSTNGYTAAGSTHGTVHNQWDSTEYTAYSGSTSGTSNVSCTTASTLTTPSPVAGPDALITNDGSGTGPWHRISYSGSTIATTTGTTGIATGSKGAGCYGGTPTSAGWSLSAANPLPTTANALRFALGSTYVGQLYSVRVTLKLTQAPGANGLINNSEVYGGDVSLLQSGSLSAGLSPVWKYLYPSVAQANSNLQIYKRVIGMCAGTSGCTPQPYSGSTVPSQSNLTLQYQVDYLNGSSGPQTGLILTDTLPSGATLTGTPTNVTNTPNLSLNSTVNGSGVNTATLTSLSSGVLGSIRYNVSFGSTAPTSPLTNTVKLTSTQVPSGVTSAATVTPTTSASLNISKTTSTPTVAPGGTATYQISLPNSGAANATAITITDTLPSDGLSSAAADGFTYASNSATATLTDASGGVTTVSPVSVATSTSGTQQVVTFSFPSGTAVVPNGVLKLSFNAVVGSNVPVSATAYANSAQAGYTSGSTTMVPTVASGVAPVTVATPVLTLSKTQSDVNGNASTATVTAGNNTYFKVTIANSGAVATSGTVSFTDTLPSGLSFVSTASSVGFTCSASNSNQTLTCSGTPTIAANGSATVVYQVQATGSAIGSLSNQVRMSAAGGDPRSLPSSCPTSGSPFCASASVTVQAAPSLTVSKTLTQIVRGATTYTSSLASMPVQSGDVLTYTVSANNASSTAASTGATITETVPANTAYSGSNEGWTVSGSNYTWTTGSIAASSSASKTFTVTVSSLPAAAIAISNTVSADSGAGCSSCTVSNATVPQISIAKVAAQSSITLGGSGSFTVTISNKGGSATSGNIVFADTLPAGMSFGSVTSGSNWSCTANNATPQVVTCTFSGTIPAYASAAPGTSSVTYSVNVSGTASTLNVNTAVLDSVNLGGDPRTNGDTTSSAPTPTTSTLNASSTNTVSSSGFSAKTAVDYGTAASASLQVAQSAINTTAGTCTAPCSIAGVAASYTVTVSNATGAATASGSTTLLSIPPGMTLNALTGSGWTCSSQGGASLSLPARGAITAKCSTTASLAAGVSANPITVTVTPVASSQGQSLTPISSVDPLGGSTPPTPATSCTPSTACANSSTTPGAGTNPTVGLGFADPLIPVGGTTTLTATLSNPTSTNLTGVALSIPLPSGLSLTSASDLESTCGGMVRVVNGQLQLIGARLPAGQSCQITAAVTTTSASVTVALAAGAIQDAQSLSNTAPASAQLQTQGAISVQKSFASTVAVAGGTVAMTIRINNTGTLPASNLQLTDSLPTSPGAMTVASSPNVSNSCGGSVSANAGASAVVLSGGVLAAGSNCTIVVNVTAPAAGTYLNIIPANTLTGMLGSGGTQAAIGNTPQAQASINFGATASISGTARQGSNTGSTVAGVSVKLYDAHGNLVASTSTDNSGHYSFTGIAPSVVGDPSTTYSVSFTPGSSGAAGLPQGSPNNANAELNGIPNANAITSITASSGATTDSQDATFIDPSGVVYNAVTRAAVPGAIVTLLNPSGVAVPAIDLAGGANAVVTGADGSYNLSPSSSYVSSNAGTYTLQITVPSGYAQIQLVSGGAPSNLIAPTASSYTPPTSGSSVLIQSQSTPPTTSQATTYYMAFNLSGSSVGVLNNNIPLDPASSLTITKSALGTLTIGTTSQYTVTVSNTSNSVPTGGATILEAIPSGLILESIGGGSSGWTCTNSNGSSLSLPAAGAITVKCVSATTIAAGASATPIPVGVTPATGTLGQTLTTYSAVDPTGGASPQTPQNPASCTPTTACAMNSATVGTGAATLFLQKTGSAQNVELGDSLQYTLVLKDVSGDPQSGVVITDTLPRGFKYIAGTATLTRSGSSSATTRGDSALGISGLGPVLQFSVGSMSAGDTATLTYFVRVGVGAQQGDGTNRAQASTATHQSSNQAAYKVQVTGGVFDQSACVFGKVYVDCNGNRVQDGPDELGIPGVRLYFENGNYMISDPEGKYSMCGIPAMTHVLKVDTTTLPKGATLVPSASRNAGDPGSLFVDPQFGELYRADFIEGSCTPQVLDAVKQRRQQASHDAPQHDKVLAPIQAASDPTVQQGGGVYRFNSRPASIAH